MSIVSLDDHEGTVKLEPRGLPAWLWDMAVTNPNGGKVCFESTL
jgi:hypothetical protein